MDGPAVGGHLLGRLRHLELPLLKPVQIAAITADSDGVTVRLQEASPFARVHVFLATSEIHREFKLRKAREEIIRLAVEGVTRARGHVRDVEFSPEDASRTELDFLVKVVEAAIAAGATTINMPDTTGYAMPEEYGRMFGYVIERARGSNKPVWLGVLFENHGARALYERLGFREIGRTDTHDLMSVE